MNISKIMTWLFTDPVTAGSGTASGNAEAFHYYLPWIIFCSLALLIPLYYALEGRKRFFGHHTLNKYLMDRFMGQVWPIGLVGFILIGARYALDSSLFAWRFWRYGWLVWVAVIALYWLYYLAFRYAGDLAAYRAQRTLEKYHPQPNKRRTARAGAR
ncbi:MAG: hypothetical protein ABI068_04435 [Ktedonobacterales bacterium]